MLFSNSQSNWNDFSQNQLIAWINSHFSLTPARLDQIQKVYPSLETAISDSFDLLKPFQKNIRSPWLKKLTELFEKSENHSNCQKFLHKVQEDKQTILSSQDSRYPQTLKFLKNYPTTLYTKGNLKLLESNQNLTVVGSRNFSKEVYSILDKILLPTCRAGVGVVSGLALGVDSLAHQTALKAKAPTIAVLGSGMDQKSFYPKINWQIAQEILESDGLILSEYGPGTIATKYTFPQRNRILAALTDLTWIVQATMSSGSLITANQARDLGKTVATTPASILDKNYEGNLSLLKNGASIISQSQDIFDLLNLKYFPNIQAKSQIQFGSELEEKIYQTLSMQPLEIDFLSQKVNLPISEINTHLTMLELSGLAQNLGENQWVKKV